jgi:hypothetical protein
MQQGRQLIPLTSEASSEPEAISFPVGEPEVVLTCTKAATTQENTMKAIFQDRNGSTDVIRGPLPQTCGKVERFHQTLKKFLQSNPRRSRSPSSRRKSMASSLATTTSARIAPSNA